MIVASFIAHALAVAAAALVARWRRPDWRTTRIVALANLPAPICVLMAAGIGVASVGPASPGETMRAAW